MRSLRPSVCVMDVRCTERPEQRRGVSVSRRKRWRDGDMRSMGALKLTEESCVAETISISAVTRLTALRCFSLLLVTMAIPPSTCNRDDGKSEGQVEALSAPLSVTAQATPTPLWAVDWGPTQPLEDETHHFLSSQETDHLRQSEQQAATTSAETWTQVQGVPGGTDPQEALLKAEGEEDGEREADDRKPEEVDPQFYVTVTISSLLILTAVVITAKLCYDRSCSEPHPPLSRGVPPPLSLALPRTLATEDSRHTLHSTPSFTDRERIPVVNL